MPDLDGHLQGLTDKQAAFVRQYVRDHNGAQAAIRAGYSAKTARQIASENLSKPDIRAAVFEEERLVADRLGITRHFVLSGYLRIWATAMSQERPDLAQANRALDALAQVLPELGLPTAGMSAVDRELMRTMEEWKRSDDGQQLEGELRKAVDDLETKMRDLDRREAELRELRAKYPEG